MTGSPQTVFGVIARRLLQLIPLLIGITLGAFFLLRLLPGDPAVRILRTAATPELVAQLHQEFGLDRSLAAQFVIFISHILRGDLGMSYECHQPVARLLLDQLPPTLTLLGLATVLSVVLAFPLALVCALRRDSIWDRVIRSIVIINLGAPSYFIGLLFLLVLAATFRWFPVGGYGEGVGGHLYHLFLPALTLGVTTVPVVLRALRTSLIETLHAEHVLMARAKGLPFYTIIGRHILRNALIPAVTLLGINAGFLVGETIFVESVFGVPGLGKLLLSAIRTRDYPTVQAVTMAFAVLTVLIQLLTDVIYILLDPRIRTRAS
jgi:peptide/nickel transport system permease protein